MRIFKISIMLLGTLSLILFHSYTMEVKGVDLFQFISFIILHGMWYSFCTKVLVKNYIYGEE
jgi:hypothetical protein